MVEGRTGEDKGGGGGRKGREEAKKGRLGIGRCGGKIDKCKSLSRGNKEEEDTDWGGSCEGEKR